MVRFEMDIIVREGETIEGILKEIVTNTNVTVEILNQDPWPMCRFTGTRPEMYMVVYNMVGGDLEHFVNHLEEIKEI